jgi:predicted Ser/Thr protein kinase
MLKILVFTELIFDTDRSRKNVLIGNNWELYMIDFTRAFRLHHFLMNPKSLLRCSRELLENLCALDAEKLEAKVSKYLTNLEFEDILKRRDKLVSHFEKLIAEKGEDEVLN